MIKRLLRIILFINLVSCINNELPILLPPKFIQISAVDISRYPEIEETSPTFFNLENKEEDFLSILKNSGVNTIRLRLWVNPLNAYSSLDEVKSFSSLLKNRGYKVWLSLHYSDTWADPGNQEMPKRWENISLEALKDSVSNYTKEVVQIISPDYIQVGNEINNGFLFPQGEMENQPVQFLELLIVAIKSIRTYSPNTKIIIHYAGLEGADWFYSQLQGVDFDIIGFSYYPRWHGKNLNELEQAISRLAEDHDKDVIIAETAYPFTLEWNDLTHNALGLEEQLIMPEYPATPEGQRRFVAKLNEILISSKRGIGLCYWGADLIAWKGSQSLEGSTWENQSLFDFNNKALPVVNEFSTQ